MSDSDIPDKTQVCIIGAGPAGVICAYIFALRGVSVILLEGEKILIGNFGVILCMLLH